MWGIETGEKTRARCSKMREEGCRVGGGGGKGRARDSRRRKGASWEKRPCRLAGGRRKRGWVGKCLDKWEGGERKGLEGWRVIGKRSEKREGRRGTGQGGGRVKGLERLQVYKRKGREWLEDYR
jgi:hypothetical protein